MAKSIKIQPLGERILVKPSEIEEKTSGGLVIPPTSEDKRPETGKVVKLGIGKNSDGKSVEFDVKVGDVIYFKKYSPEEVEIEGDKYLLIESDDVLAVIK